MSEELQTTLPPPPPKASSTDHRNDGEADLLNKSSNNMTATILTESSEDGENVCGASNKTSPSNKTSSGTVNEASKTLVSKGQPDDKISTLTSRLQLLEKRLQGRVEKNSEVETTLDTAIPQPMNIIKAFSLAESKPSLNSDSSKSETNHSKEDKLPQSLNNDNKDSAKSEPCSDGDAIKNEVAVEDESLPKECTNDESSSSVAKSECDDSASDVSPTSAKDDTNEPRTPSGKTDQNNSDSETVQKEETVPSVITNVEEEENIKEKTENASEEMDCDSVDSQVLDSKPSNELPVTANDQEKDDIKEKTDNDSEEMDCDSNDSKVTCSKPTNELPAASEESVDQEDNDKLSPSDKSDNPDDSGNKVDPKESKDADPMKKGKGIDAIARMLRKQQKKTETTKPEDSAPSEATNSTEENNNSSKSESKGYLTDTMDQFLGMYGYEKENESAKAQSPVGKETTSPQSMDVDVPPDKPPEEKKEKPTSGPLKRVKTCEECKTLKVCKYQVMMQGPEKLMRAHLCDDTCYTAFREKQKLQKANAKKAVSSTTKETCHVCKRDMKNITSIVPSIGDNRLTMCSETCFKKYQEMEGPNRSCSQCKTPIEGRNKCLTWETMEFCSEDCLGNYQNYLGSHCACCNNSVQNSSLGKFCVRFGSDIKQFCSNTCLEEFKKGLKVCTFCQKDISNGLDGFLAPVGDKGQFKDFCSQQCMEKYDSMNNPITKIPKMNHCSACNKLRTVKIQITYAEKTQYLCSETCYVAFKFSNKIKQHKCDHCHKFFELPTGDDNVDQHTIQIEGLGKRFCTKMCLNIYVLSNRKIVPCSWCKVKKYNFDMIERVDASNQVQLFCSLNCLSLFRVSLNASSSRSVKCDYCSKMSPAQYHLTMSDASVRNFCCYNCVAKFQSQYPSIHFQKVSSTGSTSNAKAVSSGKGNQTKATTQSTQVMSSMAQTRNQVVAHSRQQSATASANTIKTTTNTSMPKMSSMQTVTQQVIIKPPQPRLLKNKGTLCKPIMLTKGVSCRPHPCYKSTQTDSTGEVGKVIPIPIPIYVPLPMHMYSMPTPVPVPIPIPIPVPIFIPTLKNNVNELMASIKEIREKMPDDPYEADLLMMAEIVADRDKPTTTKIEEIKDVPDDKAVMAAQADDATNNTTDNSTLVEGVDELYDIENILAASAASPLSSVDDQDDMYEENGEMSDDSRSNQQWRNKRASSNGSSSRSARKKQKLEINDSSDYETNSPSQYRSKTINPRSASSSLNLANNLQFKYGVNAWKNWVIKKNQQLEKASQSNRKLKLFKTDILQLSADELNYSLCLFVKEVRNPSGEEYSADSIYYLCLGIQQYLHINNRIDNILTDANFEKFTECLNDALHTYESSLSVDNQFIARINVEILWESRQLGAHSPHVLLNTLLYFNTKYFGLRTVEDHLKMSFSLVVKHWKKSNKGNATCLKYYSPASPVQQLKVVKRKKEYMEQIENAENPLRCPVKLYEFYLLKCPESIKSRSDVYYLHPERSCVPDSPVWYSTQALGKEQLSKMLQRAKMIKGVFDN